MTTFRRREPMKCEDTLVFKRRHVCLILLKSASYRSEAQASIRISKSPKHNDVRRVVPAANSEFLEVELADFVTSWALDLSETFKIPK